MEELDDPEIHDIVFDRYRVIYRYDGTMVRILRIWPGAKPLTGDRLGG